MSTNILTIVAFVSSTLLALGTMIILKAIFFPASEERPRSIRLRRAENVYDRGPGRGLLSGIDRTFDRLIIESGLGLTPIMGFLWLLLAGIVSGGIGLIFSGDPLVVSLSGLTGMAALLVVFAMQRVRRLAAVREQLPHVLDMLARTTRAGKSVEQAIALVGSEAGGILGREFQSCSAQLGMGRAFDRVLKSLSQRVPLVEFRILTTTLVIQRQTGGHLSDTLERMSAVIRDRLTAARQIRATTGGGRTSAMLVSGIAPLAFLAIFALHREHFDMLFNDSTGRMLLMTGLVLEIAGLVWVYLLLKKDA